MVIIYKIVIKYIGNKVHRKLVNYDLLPKIIVHSMFS